MKLELIMAAVAAVVGQGSPANLEGDIALSSEQAITCEAEGGCALITQKAYVALTTQAYKRGFDEGGGGCRARFNLRKPDSWS